MYVLVHSVVDASFGAATVLVSFGVLIGKVSPLQILVMTLVEIPIYAGNSYLGYTVLQAVDAGEDPIKVQYCCTGEIIFDEFEFKVAQYSSILLEPISASSPASFFEAKTTTIHLARIIRFRT